MPCGPASTHYTVPEHVVFVTSLVSQSNLQFIQCFTFKEGQKSKKLLVMTLIGVIYKNSDLRETVWTMTLTLNGTGR